MAWRIWNGRKCGRFRSTPSRISPSGCFASCATPRAWDSRWNHARRSGSISPLSGACTNTWNQPTLETNFARSAGKTCRLTLKAWESHTLLEMIHPQLQRRKPDYDSLNKLGRVRVRSVFRGGIRPRLSRPTLYCTLGRLKPREASAAMRQMGFRAVEIDTIASLVPEAQKIVQVLKGRKTKTPRKPIPTSASARGNVAFIEVEFPNPQILTKLRNYVCRNGLDAAGSSDGRTQTRSACPRANFRKDPRTVF